ncbi:MAG: hypothetical protein IMZ59_07250 [Actinobacteria bacterium]|nr:hypothetical protein [Actinomycetota bacterium]
MRGIGHCWAVQLAKNRRTKEPFDTKADKFHRLLITDKIANEVMKLDLYIAHWYDTLTIAPPLIITEEQVDEGIEVLDKALNIADREVVHTDVPGSRSTEIFKKAVCMISSERKDNIP